MTADIIMGDNMKKELRILMWYLRHKLKTDYKTTTEAIHNDMVNCGNPVIAQIYNSVVEAGNKINEDYQRGVTIDFPEILLWIIYRDTAYMPIFMYILKDLMDHKEELMPVIEKYYVAPEDWYVNRWKATKDNTLRLKEEGKLSNVQGDLGFDERIFVPQHQQNVLDNYRKTMEDQISVEKKKRGWK